MTGNSEYRLQRDAWQYVQWALPDPPEGPLISALNPVPSKSKAVAGQSKALGMLKGMPDWVICLPSGRTAWAEFKAPAGSLTPEQRAIRHWLESMGHSYYEIRSLGDLAEALAYEGVPVRGEI